MRYQIFHTHRFGNSSYVFEWAGNTPPDPCKLCDVLGIDFEGERGETLDLSSIETDAIPMLSEDDYEDLD